MYWWKLWVKTCFIFVLRGRGHLFNSDLRQQTPLQKKNVDQCWTWKNCIEAWDTSTVTMGCTRPSFLPRSEYRSLTSHNWKYISSRFLFIELIIYFFAFFCNAEYNQSAQHLCKKHKIWSHSSQVFDEGIFVHLVMWNKAKIWKKNSQFECLGGACEDLIGNQ